MNELLGQMIYALAFVLLLIALLAYAYRRRQKTAGLIGLLSYQAIGQKMGVAALRVGSEVLVIGVTPTDFKLLKRLDAATADGGRQQPLAPVARLAKKQEAPSAGPADAADAIAQRVARLRKMKAELRG